MSNVQKSFGDFLRSVGKAFFQLIDLKADTDKQGTIESVRKYVSLKGYNVWILMASAMIASIGLDTNAPAIIIGAMLISPLMSPILGTGLSIGINDRELLWLSIQNFFIAIFVTIFTSYIYFKITPLGLPTAELLARTKPTLLDVGVAFFGGIAGIVAGSHKDKTNALPGVAIATALMPPLCTVGFGLAKWDISIWGGALYLFFINAVIISFTTYTIVRFLEFPLKEYVNPSEQRQTNLLIGVTVILVIIPSVFILIDTLNRLEESRLINHFVKEKINDDRREVIDWEMVDLDSTSILKIYLVGESYPDEVVPSLDTLFHQTCKDFEKTTLKLIQMDVPKQEMEQMQSEITAEIMQIIEVKNQQEEEQLQQIADLQYQVSLLETDSIPMLALQRELKALFPEIQRLKAGRVMEVNFDSIPTKLMLPTVHIGWENSLAVDTTKQRLLENYENRLYHYLKVRLGYDTLQLVRY